MNIQREAYDRSPAGLDISSHSNWVSGYTAGAERNPWRKWSDGPPTCRKSAIVVRKGRHLSIVLVGCWSEIFEEWVVYGSDTPIASKAAEWMHLPFMRVK